MAYLLKAISGLGLFGGGIALANVKLVQLLETGTCASGNTPYAIRNPYPAGTGTAILLLMAGIFAAVGVASMQSAGFGTAPAPAPSRGAGDRIAKLQTLAELRRSGALTEQEFEREKSRVLGDS